MIPRVLYGGTFDPVHVGHLAVAEHARARLDAHVDLLPAGDPPHKGPTRASGQDRLAMCRLAVQGIEGLGVDDREVRRDTPSWTVETLRALRAEIGDEAPVALLVGADSFLGLPTWREWRALPRMAHFVVAERPGASLQDTLPAELAAAFAGAFTTNADALRQAPAGRVFLLHQPLIPQSATELRRRIAAGEPWRDWVPLQVADYIVEHHLYAPPIHPTAADTPPSPPVL